MSLRPIGTPCSGPRDAPVADLAFGLLRRVQRLVAQHQHIGMQFAVERGDAVEIGLGQRDRRQAASGDRAPGLGGRELRRVHRGALRLSGGQRCAPARRRGRAACRSADGARCCWNRSRKRVPWRNSSNRSAPIFAGSSPARSARNAKSSGVNGSGIATPCSRLHAPASLQAPDRFCLPYTAARRNPARPSRATSPGSSVSQRR